jgi:CRP/FNR family transcriptional regulator, cyclic AMP receptor protein
MTKYETGDGAIYLSEYLLELNEGAGFLDRLGDDLRERLLSSGTPRKLDPGAGLFFQGDTHSGIWVVTGGRIRTFYVGPSGREITLAYWTRGHFVGGPEVFGRGQHIWSADAMTESSVVFLSGETLLGLVQAHHEVALGVIDGLVAKGKCYSALIQMLGTRSVSERLEQLLIILANTRGRREGDRIVIDRNITYEQMAAIVGATRQWVTLTLDKLSKNGVVKITRSQIEIVRPERLSA